MAQLPAPSGYWLVGADGGVFSYGEADFYGSMGDKRLNEPVVGMAATMSGAGYWEVALDGGIFAFGDAPFYGSMGGRDLNEPMIGIAATSTGEGYWTVAIDGGVFAFGDAPFYGSMGGRHLNEPVVGIVPTPTGEGYWLVAEDGGVFNFGDAPFHGSLGGDPPDEPIVGLAASGDGYVTVTTDGRIDAFGAPEVGSLPADELDADQFITAVANDANSEGFWLTADDGTVYALEGAHHWGDARDIPLNAPIIAMASVAPDSEAPTVVGDQAAAGTSTVTFSADEPIDPDSVATGDVTTTSAAAITGVEVGGGGVTITVTLDGPLAVGDTVTLAAGSVTDLAGNAGPVEAAVVTAADVTAPTLTAGAIGGDNVAFTSSEPLDPTSVGVEDVATTSAGAITTVALSSDGLTITVTLDAPLADEDTVTLLAGSVTDVHGNAGPADDLTVTVPDRTAPGVTAGEVVDDTATFVADEPLAAGSVSAADVSTTSTAAITGVTLGTDGTTITVTFDAPLADGDTVTLAAGSVTDEAGNAGPAANVVATAVVPDLDAPTITGATGVDNGDGVVSAAEGTTPADTWALVFSESMNEVSVETAAYVLEDEDGTTGTFQCDITGCVLAGDRQNLNITVLGPPEPGAAGTIAGLQYPVTITGFGSVVPEDAAGNPVDANLVGSTDVIIDPPPVV